MSRSLSATRPLRQRTREHFHIAPDTVVILYVARLTEVKLPLVFVQSMVKLALHLKGQAQSRVFHAFVVGDGEMRDSMEKELARASMQEKVTFLGIVTARKQNARNNIPWATSSPAIAQRRYQHGLDGR